MRGTTSPHRATRPERGRRAAHLLLALLVLLGCKAETFGGEDPVIDPDALQVVAGVRLPGGRITVSAPWMASLADTMTLVVDDRTELLAVRDTGGSDRFFFYLPDTLPVGSHQLGWQSSGRQRVPIGYVVTGGFSELRYALGNFSTAYGATQPIPQRMVVASISLDAAGTHTALLDVRAARIRLLAPGGSCCYGLGASYRPASFLAYTIGAYPWVRQSITLTGVTTDTLRANGIWWPLHELAPGLYLGDQKHWTSFEDDSDNVYQQLDSYFHPSRIAYSADGHWAVASHDRSDLGAMIIDRQARTYHWSPGWIAYTRPLFLPDGRLVLYGWRRDPGYDPATYGPNGEYFAHVDPVTGALADSVRFADAGSPYDQPTALSTGLIVIPSLQESHIEISFRDPNTLYEVGHARSPEFAHSCLYNTLTTLEEPALHRFYLSADDCNAAVPVWTFQLPD